MIERRQIVGLLLETLPSFREPYTHWFNEDGIDLVEGNSEQEILDSKLRLKEGDTEPLLHFLIPLPGYLMAVCQQSNFIELEAIGNLIERCIIEGDYYVNNWAIVGVLEGIQNAWAEYGSEKFTPFLGPKSLEAWNDLNDFWSQKGKYKK